MIEIKEVSYSYGFHEKSGAGVENINLGIKKGEFVVLCGRSGCGKTTVTRLINGLIPHFYEGELKGEVRIDGLDIAKSELSDTAAVIGSVFQNPASQFFNVDTTSELAFGCENQNMSRSDIKLRVEMAVKNLSLNALLDRSIFELSGGEKQQIACGSVYATMPKVYVLDEPSSNMDTKAIERLKSILTELKAQGNTIVISEHRLYYLMTLADRFIYMSKGRIERIFKSRDIMAMTQTDLAKLGLRAYDLSAVEYRLNNYLSSCDFSDKMLKIKALSVSRNKKSILNIEELELPKNSVIAVIGENGVGKSTFAKALCGLIRHKGSVFMEEKSLSAKNRTKLSFMVMQDVNNQLFCDSVYAEVSMELSEDNRDRIEALLDKMGLLKFKDRHPATLSGGQKQRTAICSAICAKKRILIYDEPTSGLDYDGMQRFCDLIIDNKDCEGVSLIITHDLELIMGCCTHILHFKKSGEPDFYLLNTEGVNRMKKFFI